MESKRKGTSMKPKLERRNALKNVDYEASTSMEDPGSLRTRSLDLSLHADLTSFRVQGVDGVDRICRTLGLSGPEEFEIPVASWADMNSRSSNRHSRHRSSQSEGGRSEKPNKVSPPEVQEIKVALAKESGGNDFVELKTCSIIPVRSFKVVRSSPLAPPPPMLLTATDNGCSNWDLLRSFAPESDEGSSFPIPHNSFDDEGVDGSRYPRAEVGGLMLGETAVLSESCSFTTSYDDDSSSTTTDPAPNTSPIGRFRPSITSWEKGELLGRGSFGSVYEGIAE